MAFGKPLQLRLFLEGEEVPVIAAQVSISVNAPAAASIQVIPLDEALDLKPRTMVHLFFLDHFEARVDPKQAEASSRSEEDRTNIPFLDNYKLLFCGEVIGFQFSKTPSSRAVVLQCLDFSSYWDTAHATAIEYGPNGNAMTHAGSLRASNTGLFDDIVNTTSDRLVTWLRQTPLTEGLKSVSGLAGGVIRMLEMMGGVPRHHKGVNDFFTVAELRCRVLAQITAEENDSTAADLLKVKVFDEWLRNGLQNIGQQISFRDMLKLLFGYVHYEVIPNPAAKFDAATAGKVITTVLEQKLSVHPQATKAVSDVTKIRDSLQKNLSNDDPDSLTKIVENYRNQLVAVDAEFASLKLSKKALTADVDSARSLLRNAILVLETTAAKGRTTTSSFIVDVNTNLDQFIKVVGESQEVVSSSPVKSTNATTQRLRTQIIRPDCFFAAPPRCNIIFPEQYTQVAYDRMYLSEVTRSLVMSYNTLVGPDALLADRILAPSIGADSKLLAVNTGKGGYRSLMKHELHTGIIPRSEWLPNTASFSSAKTDTDTTGKKDYVKLSWAKKIALFHFFKFRFGPRQASVGGNFNPYLVAGFPAVVILKPFIHPGTAQAENASDAQVIEFLLGQSKSGNPDLIPLAPSQLIGMVGGLSHSIDQNGGSTSISMHHVRQHLGIDDEFIGVFLKSKSNAKRKIRVVLNADKVSKSAASNAERLKRILLRVTPQTRTSPATKTPAKKALEQKKVTGKKTQVNRATGEVTEFDFESFIQVVTETAEKAAEKGKTAPFTARGIIDKTEDQVLVPSPPGALTVGGKGVFGKIIGVQVTDPTMVRLSSTIKFTQVEAISTPAEIPETPVDPNLQFSAGAATATVSKTDTVKGQVYKEVVLYEEVGFETSDTVPIEDILRPNWFSRAYTNENIGQKIYQPFFGVPSIIDEASFGGLGDVPASSNPTYGDPIPAETNYNTLIAELKADEATRAKISIERSINFISYIYGLVKVRGLDVDSFIRQYSNRPIATLPQMLGDPDLDLQVSSTGKATAVPRANGTTPRIGFHTMAVHPKVVDVGNLAGLLDDPDLQVQRINNSGKPGPVPPEYDVRKEKKNRVRRYLTALAKGPGYRG